MTVEEFWKEFLNKDINIVVHCKTYDEAILFCKMMNKKKLHWSNDESYLETTHWEDYKEDTCYCNNGSYSKYDWYKYYDYTIYNYSDIFNDANRQEPSFTLKDIKAGYLVELRDEGLCICVDENNKDIGLYSKDGCWTTSLSEYENDFCNIDDYEEYDIMKVYGLHKSGNLFNTNNRELLWERKEIEITTQQLKELYCKNGEKLVIKDNDDVLAEI